MEEKIKWAWYVGLIHSEKLYKQELRIMENVYLQC